MQHLDQQVVQQALDWLQQGQTVWLCTVLSTFGSSPREPGAMMVARADGQHVGSLSGGCVEDDFLERLQQGEFRQRLWVERYGDNRDAQRPQVQLPCGGILEVLVERLQPDAPALRITPEPDTTAEPACPVYSTDADTLATARTAQQQLQHLLAALQGQYCLLREIDLNRQQQQLLPAPPESGPRVCQSHGRWHIRVGPTTRLIIAGLSSVARHCAQFAVTLGYEVIVCEPREEEYRAFAIPGVRLEPVMPSAFIRRPGNSHAQTAIVAMTHDPRIDDLAMIEAVKTSAFYIGVMGSRRTSDSRAARLLRSGGLSTDQIERIHMPIGLALGSKTPAEIALAILADVLRCQRGVKRDAI